MGNGDRFGNGLATSLVDGKQVMVRHSSPACRESVYGRPMRPQPLIAVTDVEATNRWYQRLLDCQGAHGGTEYERLV